MSVLPETARVLFQRAFGPKGDAIRNLLEVETAGTGEASKYLITDSSGDLALPGTLGVTGATTLTGALTADTIARGTAVTAEHGAGSIGTGVAPVTYRYTRDGVIITEIQIDLTGLACKGTAAKDAIGLAAGGAAMIGRYVVATCGVVYRVEMICLETPGQGTATITVDIDLGADDAADIAYDGAVDDVVVNTGGLAAGKQFVSDVPALTADDYLYLVEGDTAATTGVYNAGMVIIKLYGHPVLA